MIDISRKNDAAILAALYNANKPLGMGFLNPNCHQSMTEAEAQKILDRGQRYFDYLNGRVMKISLEREVLDPYLYDRDNGKGAAERIISALPNVRPAMVR